MIRDHSDLASRVFRVALFPEDFPVTCEKVKSLFQSFFPFILGDIYYTHLVLRDRTGKYVRSFVYPFNQTEITQFISLIESKEDRVTVLTYGGVNLTEQDLRELILFAWQGVRDMAGTEGGITEHLQPVATKIETMYDRMWGA